MATLPAAPAAPQRDTVKAWQEAHQSIKRELDTWVKRIGDGQDPLSAGERQRLASLIKATENLLKVGPMEAQVTAGVWNAAMRAEQASMVATAKAIPQHVYATVADSYKDLGWDRVVNEKAYQAVINNQIGQLTSDFNNLTLEQQQRLATDLANAVATGSNPRDLAQSVKGTVDEWFRTGQSRSVMISRTNMAKAYDAASLSVYQDAADRGLIKGWRWVAHGANPCDVCLTLDGAIFDTNDDTYRHPNCTCTNVPVLMDERGEPGERVNPRADTSMDNIELYTTDKGWTNWRWKPEHPTGRAKGKVVQVGFGNGKVTKPVARKAARTAPVKQPANAPDLEGKDFRAMTPDERIKAAEVMYGTGSKQHRAAIAAEKVKARKAAAKKTAVKKATAKKTAKATPAKPVKATVKKTTVKKATPVKKTPAPKPVKQAKPQQPKVTVPETPKAQHTIDYWKEDDFARAKELGKEWKESYSNRFNDPNGFMGAYKVPEDMMLKSIVKEQGFDAKPTVVSKADFAELKESGLQYVGRGMTADTDDVLANYVSQFKEGELFTPRGIFGSGTYGSPNKDVLDYFSTHTAFGEERPTGTVMNMLLKPDAKVIEYDDLKGMDKDLDSVRMKYFKDGDPIWVMQDDGRKAAMHGYDAVRIPSPTINGQKLDADYYLILNRGALIVEDVQ